MRAHGRVYLQTDGARELDRIVNSDVRLVYYPTGTSADLPIIVRISHHAGRVHVSVGQDREDGTIETLGGFSRDAGRTR